MVDPTFVRSTRADVASDVDRTGPNVWWDLAGGPYRVPLGRYIPPRVSCVAGEMAREHDICCNEIVTGGGEVGSPHSVEVWNLTFTPVGRLR